MTISMYEASVPVFVRVLENMSAVLDKAAAHAAARRIDESVFIHARLAPDMFALPRQVQIATDIVKGGAARLAGAEVPRWEDDEATFAELQARIAKAIDFVQGFGAAQIDGSEERDITIRLAGRDAHFKGLRYLLDFVLPNLYFHATTTFAILRHNGVEIGKMDFLGAAALGDAPLA
ncbi:MAG: DUF1993 family protein [Pseudomonadota bacterium]